MIKTDQLTASVKNFISQQYVLILFSFIVLIGFALFAQLPYANLILTPENIACIYWLLIMQFFRPKISTSFLLAVILLLFTPLLIVVGLSSIAEKVGNVIFFLLVAGFVQTFLLYLKTVKHSND